MEDNPDSGTKTCPDCAEQVKGAAKVCRFCGYRFEQTVQGIEESDLHPVARPFPLPRATDTFAGSDAEHDSPLARLARKHGGSQPVGPIETQRSWIDRHKYITGVSIVVVCALIAVGILAVVKANRRSDDHHNVSATSATPSTSEVEIGIHRVLLSALCESSHLAKSSTATCGGWSVKVAGIRFSHVNPRYVIATSLPYDNGQPSQGAEVLLRRTTSSWTILGEFSSLAGESCPDVALNEHLPEAVAQGFGLCAKTSTASSSPPPTTTPRATITDPALLECIDGWNQYLTASSAVSFVLGEEATVYSNGSGGCEIEFWTNGSHTLAREVIGAVSAAGNEWQMNGTSPLPFNNYVPSQTVKVNRFGTLSTALAAGS